MKVCVTVWLLSVAAGCSVNNAAKTANIQNRNTAVPSIVSKAPDKNGDSKTVDCDDPNGFRLVVVKDPERASQNLGTTPRILNVVAGDEIKVAIKVPTDSDAQGFSLVSTEKTKEGFEITIEYGSRIYYRKQFNFICKEGNFYLYQVKVENFDKHDPENMAKWDRKEQKIKPNLPIEKFSIFEYLAN